MTSLHHEEGLRPLEDKGDPVLSGSVVGVAAAIVYELTDNHNAWHSTLSGSDYSVRHPTLESAKSVAEGRRRQGLYFSIYETPAIAFWNDEHLVAFLDRDPSAAMEGADLRLVRSALLLLPFDEWSLRQIVGAFHEGSLLWAKRKQPKYTLVALHGRNVSGSLSAISPHTKLVIHQSSSTSGRNYRLSWNALKHDCTVTNVLKLAAAFGAS